MNEPLSAKIINGEDAIGAMTVTDMKVGGGWADGEDSDGKEMVSEVFGIKFEFADGSHKELYLDMSGAGFLVDTMLEWFGSVHESGRCSCDETQQ